jgi:hypothetical protein
LASVISLALVDASADTALGCRCIVPESGEDTILFASVALLVSTITSQATSACKAHWDELFGSTPLILKHDNQVVMHGTWSYVHDMH